MKGRIDEADAALSKVSGFTSTDIEQTFTQLVRTTQNVTQALYLNAVAADVARGRGIPLISAAIALGKAYSGQNAALRRLGITLPANVKGMDAIRIVAQRYAGQAQAGATATDHLRTSIHEAQINIGKGLTPVVSGLAAAFNDLAGAYIKFREAAAKMPGGKEGFFSKLISGTVLEQVHSFVGSIHNLADGINALIGRTAKVKTVIDFSKPDLYFFGSPSLPGGAPSATARGAPARLYSASQRNTWFDATIARQLDRVQDLALGNQPGRLGQIAAEIRARIQATKDVTRRLTLEDNLVSVLRQQKQAQADITAQIKAGNQALKDRAKAAKDAAAAAVQALKTQADAIKSAALERLQRHQTGILNKRALDDAKQTLRVEQRIGTQQGIRKARQGVSDAQFAIMQARLEASPATLSKAGQFAFGGVIINVNGVTDPDAVARKVAEVLERRSRHLTKQRRGPKAAA
jgi:hypothetical protein